MCVKLKWIFLQVNCFKYCFQNLAVKKKTQPMNTFFRLNFSNFF